MFQLGMVDMLCPHYFGQVCHYTFQGGKQCNPRILFCLHIDHLGMDDMTSVHTCPGMYPHHKVDIVFDLEVCRNIAIIKKDEVSSSL